MADDATSPVAAQDDSAPTTEVAETTETETEIDPDAPPVEAADDTEEVELDGQRYRVPKPLKPALMMHADYTRKTQEVAEQRRSLESEQQRFTQEREAHQAYLQDHARIIAFDEQLKGFEKVDWQSWLQTDPIQANAAWMRFQQLKDARRDADAQIREKENTRRSEAEAAKAKRLQERHTIFAREVPGWSPEMANKLTEFALTQKFSVEELNELSDPRYVNVLRLAHLGSQLEKQQRAAAKAAKAEANPVPTVRTAGNPAAGQLHDKLSTEEWMRRRNKQIAQQRN